MVLRSDLRHPRWTLRKERKKIVQLALQRCIVVRWRIRLYQTVPILLREFAKKDQPEHIWVPPVAGKAADRIVSQDFINLREIQRGWLEWRKVAAVAGRNRMSMAPMFSLL